MAQNPGVQDGGHPTVAYKIAAGIVSGCGHTHCYTRLHNSAGIGTCSRYHGNHPRRTTRSSVSAGYSNNDGL